MAIKHPFTSAKSDGGDATLVRPSDWNDSHLSDDNIIAQAIGRVVGTGFGAGPTGVESGAGVTAQGTPDQTVAVATGTVRIGGRKVVVTGGNVSLTAADGTNPRWDAITVDTSATKAAVDGTAARDPVYPTIPDGRVVLAYVYRAANDNTIDTADITDTRKWIPSPPHEDVTWYGADPTGTNDSQPAFAAAHDALTAGIVSTHTISVPVGQFKFNSTWTLTGHGIIVRGASYEQFGGSGGSVLKSGATSMTVVKFDAGTLLHSGPHFEHLNFLASSGHTGVTCLSMQRVNRWSVKECYFNSYDENQNTAMVIDTVSTDNDWWTVEHCHFRYFLTICQMTAVGGRFLNNGFTTGSSGTAFTGTFDSLLMQGNWFDAARGIVVTAGGAGMQNCQIIGNGFEFKSGPTSPMIEFGDASDTSDSDGNFIAFNVVAGQAGSQDFLLVGSRGHSNYLGPNWKQNLGTGSLYDVSTAIGGIVQQRLTNETGEAQYTGRARNAAEVTMRLQRIGSQGNVLEITDTSNTVKQAWQESFWDLIQATAPGNPSTNYHRVYVDSADGLLKVKKSDGTIYTMIPRQIVDAKGDLVVATAADTVTRQAVGTDGYQLEADSAQTNGIKWAAQTFTISAVLEAPAGADAWIVWRAPYACTVTAIRGYVDTGTTTVINAFKGSVASPTNFSTADMTITSATTWISDTTLDTTSVASGDAVGVELVTLGTATEVTIQIDFTRP